MERVATNAKSEELTKKEKTEEKEIRYIHVNRYRDDGKQRCLERQRWRDRQKGDRGGVLQSDGDT